MKYIIDIDGVIGKKLHWTAEDSYLRAKEMFLSIEADKRVVDRINALRDTGHVIILHTSRLWHDYEITVAWLKMHGVRYDTLIMAKPLGDFYIDDKNMSVEDFLK